MKNILYIHAGAELYGADIVLLNLINGLNKEKYKPYVILPCDGPLVDKMKQNNINVEVIPYPILRRQYFNIKGIFKYIAGYFKYSKILATKAKEYNIDILHVNTIAVLEGIYIKNKAKVKLIWHIHEILEKPKIIAKFLSKLVAKYADKVVVVSNAVKKHLETMANFKKEIKVIYNGVDNEIFNSDNDVNYLKEEFKIPENSRIIGMIGRINSWKGQKDFIDATNKLLKKHTDLYAMLLGGVFEGQEWRKKELEEYISKQENSDRIILSDYRVDTKNIHNLFDIFVLPSTEPDPLPTVVLESMATGKPIVAYKHGGVCEMVKENFNGLFAIPRDVEDLSNKIEQMLESDYKKFGKNSYERQKEFFSLQSYIKNFEQLYDEI